MFFLQIFIAYQFSLELHGLFQSTDLFFSLILEKLGYVIFFEYIVLLHLLCSLSFVTSVYVTLFMIVFISVFFLHIHYDFSQMFPSKYFVNLVHSVL